MKYHMSVSVTGALKKPDSHLRPWIGAITVDGKPLKTVQEIRKFFEDQLAEGHEVIPCGDCDNFDYKNGCMGHESDSARDKEE
jgi:hypothetical protein